MRHILKSENCCCMNMCMCRMLYSQVVSAEGCMACCLAPWWTNSYIRILSHCLGPPRRWLFWCYSRWNGIGAAALKLLVRIQLAPLMVYTKAREEHFLLLFFHLLFQIFLQGLDLDWVVPLFVLWQRKCWRHLKVWDIWFIHPDYTIELIGFLQEFLLLV